MFTPSRVQDEENENWISLFLRPTRPRGDCGSFIFYLTETINVWNETFEMMREKQQQHVGLCFKNWADFFHLFFLYLPNLRLTFNCASKTRREKPVQDSSLLSNRRPGLPVSRFPPLKRTEMKTAGRVEKLRRPVHDSKTLLLANRSSAQVSLNGGAATSRVLLAMFVGTGWKSRR